MNNELTQHLEAIKENAVDIISDKELLAKLKRSLKSKKLLKLKIGFDPTASDIHLGHTVLLRKLRKLQNLGHEVLFIIGDFTAKIGDPSQKNVIRPVLSDKEIKSNASTYTRQAFKILDRKKTKIIYNSLWYKKMPLSDFLPLLSSYTLARILERDDFSRRIKENQPLTLLEAIYPLIQGYDSYKIKADIEFGGTDQKFNLIVGRHIQEAFRQSPQAIVTLPLLVGLDGKNKMSKSLGNYIGITENAKSMFGKLMSISDEAMWEYLRLLTDADVNSLRKIHPKEAKLALAKEIVSFYHSPKIAKCKEREFERVFSKGKLPNQIPVYKTKESKIDIVEFLSAFQIVSSKNEARRLLSQGGISYSNVLNLNFEVAREQQVEIPAEGKIFKIGKKKFIKISF